MAVRKGGENRGRTGAKNSRITRSNGNRPTGARRNGELGFLRILVSPGSSPGRGEPGRKNDSADSKFEKITPVGGMDLGLRQKRKQKIVLQYRLIL